MHLIEGQRDQQRLATAAASSSSSSSNAATASASASTSASASHGHAHSSHSLSHFLAAHPKLSLGRRSGGAAAATAAAAAHSGSDGLKLDCISSAMEALGRSFFLPDAEWTDLGKFAHSHFAAKVTGASEDQGASSSSSSPSSSVMITEFEFGRILRETAPLAQLLGHTLLHPWRLGSEPTLASNVVAAVAAVAAEEGCLLTPCHALLTALHMPATCFEEPWLRAFDSDRDGLSFATMRFVGGGRFNEFIWLSVC